MATPASTTQVANNSAFGGPNAAQAAAANAALAATTPATVPTKAPTGQTATTAPVSTPTTIVSSQPAAQQVNQKIVPALTQAQQDIAAQNEKKRLSNQAQPGYDVFGNPVTGTPLPTGGAATPLPKTPLTPEETIANTPDAGHQFAYDASGNRVQVAVGSIPPGYSATNPVAAPTQPVSDTATDTVGNTYKQFADGTYGKFDATGAYQGAASAQDFQNTKAGASIFNSLNQALNGTYPLTANQQAQVDGIKQQFQVLIDQQKTANANFTGGTTVAENLYGMGNSLTGLGEIKGTVDAGIAKIADLNSKMSSAVTAMESAFQSDNLNMLKTAYDIYSGAVKSRQDELDKLHAAATAAAESTRTYNLNVATFNQTKSQNAFDNALKTEQQAFNEKHSASTEAETARHDKATEAIDAYKAGMGAGGGQGVGGITQSAQLGVKGPDPVSQKAVLDQITQKYGPMTAIAIKGLADYSMNPTDWKAGASKGMTRDQAVTLAKMYDPTYNDAEFSVRATYMKNLASNTSGTVGSAINSANKAVNHLTAFVTSMQKLPNGPSSMLNAFDNAVTLNQGVRANLSAAHTEGTGVADELAKFFKGTGVTDAQSVQDWKNQLSTNASSADVHGLTQGAITLLSGQLETLSEQYANTMGKAPTNNFLGTSAMANLSSLKNQGYTVNIPGVQYTDKNAYIKYDSSAASNMTAATQQLQAAGLPLTPENILQLAQSQ